VRAVNLIPAEQRGGGSVTGKSEGAAFIVLGMLGGLAILALVYGLADHQVSSRRGEVASITTQAQVAQAQASQLAPYTSFIALREQRAQAVAQLVDSRFDWAHAFHELGRVMPFDASLTSVQGTVGAAGASGSASAPAAAAPAAGASAAASGSSVASATPTGSVPTFTVVGCATSQSEVAQVLVRLRLIDGVASVQLQSSTKSTSGASGSGSAASSSGGCPSHDPAFTVKVTFAALPTVPAPTHSASGSTPVAVTAGGASATPVSTANGGS